MKDFVTEQCTKLINHMKDPLEREVATLHRRIDFHDEEILRVRTVNAEEVGDLQTLAKQLKEK